MYPLGTTPVSGVLALRVWKATLTSLDPDTGGGFESAPIVGDPAVLRVQSILPFYRNDERSLPRIVIATVLIVIGLLILLLFLRDRRQWLYLWLAIYLTADGIRGFRRLSSLRFGFHLITDQLIAQFIGAFEDISLWLLLLSIFGLTRDRRRRGWTAVLGVLSAAQVVNTTTIYFWQYAGLGMQWIDAITTAIYDITPIYIFFIVGFRLGAQKAAGVVAASRSLVLLWHVCNVSWPGWPGHALYPLDHFRYGAGLGHQRRRVPLRRRLFAGWIAVACPADHGGSAAVHGAPPPGAD